MKRRSRRRRKRKQAHIALFKEKKEKKQTPSLKLRPRYFTIEEIEDGQLVGFRHSIIFCFCDPFEIGAQRVQCVLNQPQVKKKKERHFFLSTFKQPTDTECDEGNKKNGRGR